MKRADAKDPALLAELDAIEKQVIDRPSSNPADLKAELKFLALIARDHDWNDRLETLYA
jgi:hypothetical protein